MKYFEKFNPKKYHFLDFQAKIMLGVVNKNCLQLNNSQLLLLESSVSCVQLYSLDVYIFPQYNHPCRDVQTGLLCFTFKNAGWQRISRVVCAGTRVRMSIDCVYII